MKRRSCLSHAFLALTLLACSEAPSSSTTPEAGSGGSAGSAGSAGAGGGGADVQLPDATAPDAPPDAQAPDVTPDAQAPDVTPDVRMPDDVDFIDVPTLDRGTDVAPDAPPDDAPTASCGQTHESILIAAHLSDGTVESCWTLPRDAGGWPKAHRIFSGIVTDVATTDGGAGRAVTLDTCAGDGCGPSNVVFDVTGPVTFDIPVGAYVEAEYFLEQPFGCTQFLRLSNLPEWNGKKNPISDSSKVYVIASDGLRIPNKELAPIGVSTELLPLGCVVDAGPSCTPAATVDDYVFRFSRANEPPLTVAMGQTRSWTIGGQEVLVKNLRSYQTTWCDDYWNWAFTFVGK